MFPSEVFGRLGHLGTLVMIDAKTLVDHLAMNTTWAGGKVRKVVLNHLRQR